MPLPPLDPDVYDEACAVLLYGRVDVPCVARVVVANPAIERDDWEHLPQPDRLPWVKAAGAI